MKERIPGVTQSMLGLCMKATCNKGRLLVQLAGNVQALLIVVVTAATGG